LPSPPHVRAHDPVVLILLVLQDLIQVTHLLTQGESASSLDDKQHTALHWAALHNCRKVAQHLIHHDAPLNAVESDYSQTPLHWAVLKGHYNMVRLLIHAGASLEVEDSAGCTPVHYGAQYGQQLCTQILIMEGANSEPLDQKGRTPLMWAGHLGHQNVAMYLIARGNALNQQDTEQGRTALHWAARSGHRLPALVLQRAGIDLSLQDKDNRTASDLARFEADRSNDQTQQTQMHELANELDSYQSKSTRIKYLWNQRTNPENVRVTSLLGTSSMSLPFFYYNVVNYTPYHSTLLLQMTLTVLIVYLVRALIKQKELGAIVESELPISGNPAAPQHDSFFDNVLVHPDSHMAWPFRAAVSTNTGMFIRNFSHSCDLTGAHVCGENYRQFIMLVLVSILNGCLMLFIAIDVISANVGSPSLIQVHLWFWYNLWTWKYTLLTLWTGWWLVVVFSETTRNLKYLNYPIRNVYVHEVENYAKLRYLQDPAGSWVLPFARKNGMENIVAFCRGKVAPDHDVYLYSQLNVGQWKHPQDKRNL